MDSQQAPLRLAVLVSGSGSNLQALIDAIEGQQLPEAEIALVISSRADAYGLQRALKHKIPAVYLPWTRSQRMEAEARTLAQPPMVNERAAGSVTTRRMPGSASPAYTTERC